MMSGADRPNSRGNHPEAESPSGPIPPDSESIRSLLDAACEEQLSEGSVRRLLERIAPGTNEEPLADFGQGLPLDPSTALPTDMWGQSQDAAALPAGVWGQSQDAARGPGRYRILRKHAEGGLGEVYVALDDELHREVALKTVRLHHLNSPESRSRFLREAEITAGLEHPGVVPVYGLGSDESGRPFYAMRFIGGDTLKDAIARFHQGPGVNSPARTTGERTLELLKLLERFIDVSNTVAYAHSRGILHRDLKPANVLLGAYGETLVVDWGLAKPLDRPAPAPDLEDRTLAPSSYNDALETRPSGVVGTPAYMSPEQAAGLPDRLGPASDVYSLGATLYTLLTGRAPFEHQLYAEQILNRVLHGVFELPRKIDPKIPRPLERICLKAMALRPEDRYQSARGLADDIERWIAGEPVEAWRETLPERALRWIRRHRPAFIAALSVGLSSLIGLASLFALEASNRQHLKNAAEINAKLLLDLAHAEDRLGALCREVGRTDEAAAHYGRALNVWRRLAAGHPEVYEYRGALNESRRQLDSLSTKPTPGGPISRED